MNFDYSEEQQLLADSVRRFLAEKYSFDARKAILDGQGWSADIWAKFAELGIIGLPLPADHGGFGGGAVDLLAVMEAFGEALVVEPLVPTYIAARLMQRHPLLSKVAEGGLKLAFAHAEKGARYRTDFITTRFQGGTLQGEKAAVVGAPLADKIVVSARDGERIGVFLIDPPPMRAYSGIDGMRAADMQLQGVKAEK